jgi:predicted RNA-binding protein with PUA-like domain
VAFWILKSEPSTYSYEDLVKEGKTVWDGVHNPQALMNIRSMKKGDLAFFYHSGEGKCIVGIAEIVSSPYPDPKQKDPKLAVIEIAPKKKVNHEITLSDIKATKMFSELKLVRQPRLSVIPVPPEMWKALLRMCGEQQ